MESSNETEDAEERPGVRDYCYEDFDASLSDDTTNVATLSSCSTPSSLTASSRGPPSVACDEIRGDAGDDRDEGDDGAAGTRKRSQSRRPVKRKKKNHVSSVTSPVIANGSDKSSEYTWRTFCQTHFAVLAVWPAQANERVKCSHMLRTE